MLVSDIYPILQYLNAHGLHVVDMLPSPFDPSPTDEQLTQRLQHQIDTQIDYDWATFINAYALGRWDPLKTPHPPRSQLQPPTLGHPMRPSCHSVDGLDMCDSPELASPAGLWEPGYYELPYTHETPNTAQTSLTGSAPPQYHVPNSIPIASGGPPLPASPEVGIASRRSTMPMNLGFAHRLRNSFADMRTSNGQSSHPHSGMSDSIRPANISNADVTTTAAAIRLAAARVSIAPLALPSPEHELTDPMRGVTATIPGSHPPEFLTMPDSLPKSPNTTRKTRLSSFWQGTQDVEEIRLPTIEASPPETMDDPPAHAPTHAPTTHNGLNLPFAPSVVPATAPVKVSVENEDDDYFGSTEAQKYFDSASTTSDYQSVGSGTSVSRPDHEVSRHSSAPPFDYQPATVPALPRRICLTRQTSAPLPTVALHERRLRTARPASESAVLSLAGRSAKEEQMFGELGYLTPPNPPDELERRRALYK